jgi:hypothetical protein
VWVNDITWELLVDAVVQFFKLWDAVRRISLGESVDSVTWKWTADGSFSSRLACRAFFHGTTASPGAAQVWNSFAPYKFKFHAWLALRVVVGPRTDVYDKVSLRTFSARYVRRRVRPLTTSPCNAHSLIAFGWGSLRPRRSTLSILRRLASSANAGQVRLPPLALRRQGRQLGHYVDLPLALAREERPGFQRSVFAGSSSPGRHAP